MNSEEQVSVHNITRCHAGAGAGIALGKWKTDARSGGASWFGTVPEFGFAFIIPGEEEAGHKLIVLVGSMRHTAMTLSTVIPLKSTGEFVVTRIMAFLSKCGWDRSKIIPAATPNMKTAPRHRPPGRTGGVAMVTLAELEVCKNCETGVLVLL